MSLYFMKLGICTSFKIIGNIKGNTISDVEKNLNELFEILNNSKFLKNTELTEQLNLKLNNFKKDIKEEYLDELHCFLADYFTIEFADIFVLGRFVDEWDGNTYSDNAEHLIFNR